MYKQSLRNVENLNPCQDRDLKMNLPKVVMTARGKTGGGTWIHPRLVVHAARYLDVSFAVWCDQLIFDILSGKHPWVKARADAAQNYVHLSKYLKASRERVGKETTKIHYIREARLCNFVFSGQFEPINRELLSKAELKNLGEIEFQASMLVMQSLPYQDRKKLLVQACSKLGILSPIAAERSQEFLSCEDEDCAVEMIELLSQNSIA